MSRLPLLSGRQVVKVLTQIGYVAVRQRGSHIRLQHQHRSSITVPDHKIIGRGLMRKILRDAELSIEDFNNLL